MRRIEGYEIAWNLRQRRGYFSVKLEDGTGVGGFVDNAEDFAALAAVLKEPTIYLHESGTIGTVTKDFPPPPL